MVELEAKKMILEYDEDGAAANTKYSGMQVRVTGELYFIGESNGNHPMILFRSPESSRLMVGGYFEGSWDDESKLIVSGMFATIEGIVKEKVFGDIIEIKASKITKVLLNSPI